MIFLRAEWKPDSTRTFKCHRSSGARLGLWSARGHGTEGFSATFWLYLAAVALIAAGYADYPLIAYHFGQSSVIPQPWIPILYAVAMGTDALPALLFGRWFDFLALAALLSALFAPLVFWGGAYAALAGMVLWGIGMGAQESVMRSALGGLVSPDKRGTAYGLLNAGYGLAWFLGSMAMGILYDASLPTLVAFSVVMQLVAVPVFLWIKKRTRSPSG